MDKNNCGIGIIMIIDLGTISPKKVSLFKVGATSSVSNVTLSYAYKEGRLPPGLAVFPDGGISGTCGERIFEMDQGDTTFDSKKTSFEKTYVFTVTATGQFGNVTSDQAFSIDVVRKTSDKIGNMIAKPRPDNTSLASFQSLINNTKIFTNDTQYRPYDTNFDTKIPSFIILSGISLKLLSYIQNLLQDNSYNFKLRVGDYKLALAKDKAGDTIYEVIYSELIDPNSGANDSFTLKSHGLQNITIQLRTDTFEIGADAGLNIPGTEEDTIYSNDVVNIQNELKAGLTVNNFDYLPLWMQTPQSVVRGFRLALPIKYLKPGAGSQALYRLKNEINYDPKQLDIDIDRLIIDDNLGTTFNDLSRITYTGDGSTTIFTSPYRVTKPNHLIITVDGLGVTDFNMIGDITTDTPHISSDTELYSTNNDSPSNPQISFNHAPINGSTINVKLQPTTFGKRVVTTFDTSITATTDTNLVKSDESIILTDGLNFPLRVGADDADEHTTFDNNGTKFTQEEVTFDRKIEPAYQLMFSKSANTDGITHISKEPKLVRTV